MAVQGSMHCMSTPQAIMLTHLSLKFIQQRLATFLRFIQRCGITSQKLCIALFRHLVSLRFLLSRWQILREKQWRRVRFFFLGITKPKIEEESGSTTNADGRSRVSGGMNDQSLRLLCSLLLMTRSFPSTT